MLDYIVFTTNFLETLKIIFNQILASSVMFEICWVFILMLTVRLVALYKSV